MRQLAALLFLSETACAEPATEDTGGPEDEEPVGLVDVADLAELDGEWWATRQYAPDSCESGSPCWWTHEYTLYIDAEEESYSTITLEFDDTKQLVGAWRYFATASFPYPGVAKLENVSIVWGQLDGEWSGDISDLDWSGQQHGRSDWVYTPVMTDGDVLLWADLLLDRVAN